MKYKNDKLLLWDITIKSFGSKFDNLNFLFKNWFNVPIWFVLTSWFSEEEVRNFFYSYINTDYYIVRSSSSIEDWLNISYAWIFKSIYSIFDYTSIYYNYLSVLNSIEWSIVDSYELKLLWKKNSNKIMNVIFQEYIFWDYSWIYFSNLSNFKLLSFVKWWNSLLVDWEVDGTNIYMDLDFKILNQEYNYQTKILTKDFKILDYNKKNYIDKILFLSLIKTFMKLEKFYSYPIDVEWLIKENKVYILQVRPITT